MINSAANAQQGNPLRVTEHKLQNGFTVWINEDHTQPKVYGAVVVNAGAKNSPNTGIAHYFEHIMFKGTQKIGTLDFAAEKIYLDSIKVKYDELAQTSDIAKRKEIQLKINELTLKSAHYAIPNEFVKLITRYGGSGLNAGTGQDMTIYYNIFSPQYLVQWAEINSERLIDPVFRLFQSELETVYEEKNLYNDRLGSLAMDKVMDIFFAPHPYRYQIVGSTENLKNPRLSEMEKFFNDYYVAGNMCLILCGDINTKEALPVLEKSFGRLRSGNAPAHLTERPREFKGAEKYKIKLPVPVVKVRAMVWRGVPANDKDEFKLLVLSKLLNNSNGTGYLDKLVSDNKLLAAQLITGNFNEAGILGVGFVPKLVLQSKNNAEKQVKKQIDRIKRGDFSDEMLKEIKLELKRTFELETEEPLQRGIKMATLFTQGKTWEEYLAGITGIENISREDVVNTADKYFTDNYLQLDKKTGNYPKNKLQKPDFKPIIPKNTEAESAYARDLEKIPFTGTEQKFIDFSNDAELFHIKENINLYCVKNPVNDIFSIKFKFGKGRLESKLAGPVSEYISLLGTTSLSFEQFRNKLQTLGSTFIISSNDNDFVLTIQGFDKNLDSTLMLIGKFLAEVKSDPKKLKKIIQEERINFKAETKDPLTVAQMVAEKVIYGNDSRYLNRLSQKEIKKLTPDALTDEFRKLVSEACNIHYCGNLNGENVLESVKRYMDLTKITSNEESPYIRKVLPVDAGTVYLYEDKTVSQSVIINCITGEDNPKEDERRAIALFNNYFGGNMMSIIFQEVREFRSLAYMASSFYSTSPLKEGNDKGLLYTVLTTQSDKTIEAMKLVDSLICNMPVKPDRLDLARRNVINSCNNNFPDFRSISEKISSLKQHGYYTDPNISLVKNLNSVSIEDINDFYKRNIKDKPHAWIIVGNPDKIDMKELSKFGRIIKVNKKEIRK